MSFGFSAGDFLEVGHLAWRLYRDCYKVARGAPQEFQLLVAEISTLSNSLTILQEEVKDPESTIVQAGEDRVLLIKGILGNVLITLKKLEKYAKKYEIMGSGSKMRQKWTQVKWSFDWTSIEGLRSRLHQHNTMMSLILTQIGNSSLQRIESSTNALENDVQAIRGYIASHEGSELLTPSLSVVEDDHFRSAMSATLLKYAETNQPWSTIGVSQWIETGRWWLLRAQLELYSITLQAQPVPVSAYANLIKASWILVDIIACHPQVSFLSSSTRAEVTSMSSEIKREFERITSLELIVPDLKDITDEDLQIWEGNQTKTPSFRPRNTPAHLDYALDGVWGEEGGEKALFLKAATCELQAVAEPTRSLVYFLVQQDAIAARLVAKNQNGSADMVVPFAKPVRLERRLSQVVVNDEKIIFSSEQEATLLYCLLEAANYYYSDRTQIYHSLDAFKAYVVLVAIKNRHPQLAAGLLAYASIRPLPSDRPPVVSTVTAIAEDYAEGRLNEEPSTRAAHTERGTGLMSWAIWIGHAPLVQLLIAESTSFRAHPSQTLSALSIAAYCGYDSVVQILIDSKYGSEKDVLHAQDKDGMMPLHHASQRGHIKVVRRLLKAGAKITAQASEKRTPLHLAAQAGHADVVQLLLDKNAPSDARDKEDFTPLLLAAEKGREQVIAVLLEENVDFGVREKHGMNVTHLALECKISEATYGMISQRYWDSIQPPFPPSTKRVCTSVSFEMDSDWATLYLDTKDAEFEYPTLLPANVQDFHHRAFRIGRPADVTSKFFKFSINLHVIHAPGPLEFSTGHGTLGGRGNQYGKTKLIAENGGNFTTGPTNHARNFRRGHIVETDPNAAEFS